MKLSTFPAEPSLEEKQARGVRIMTGKVGIAYTMAQLELVQKLRAILPAALPIILPTIEPASIYTDKAGPEVLGQMYTFKDKSDRDLCLRPEATATCQLLGKGTYKTYPNLVLFYWQKCYRYERPQAGRYREFTQFGVEVLNPNRDWTAELIGIGELLLTHLVGSRRWEVKQGVKRGLGIYNDAGFEFVAEELGAQKQILGGGPYDGGQGFAIGIDRVLLIEGCTDNLVKLWTELGYKVISWEQK